MRAPSSGPCSFQSTADGRCSGEGEIVQEEMDVVMEMLMVSTRRVETARVRSVAHCNFFCSGQCSWQ